MKRKLPKLRSDKASENFVAISNLTRYGLTGMKVVKFTSPPKRVKTAKLGRRPS